MTGHLRDRDDRVDVAVFLQPGHLLGRDNDVDDLDDLGGLNADAGKANPALVAGAAVLTEDDQGDQEENVDDAEQLPLLAQQVGIDEGEHNKGGQTEKQGKDLNNDAFDRAVDPAGGLHGNRGDAHHIDPKQRTDQAHDKEKDICTFKEHLGIDFQSLQMTSPPFPVRSMLSLKARHSNIRNRDLQVPVPSVYISETVRGGRQLRLPVAYMSAVTATTGAVSQRRMRSPMEQM